MTEPLQVFAQSELAGGAAKQDAGREIEPFGRRCRLASRVVLYFWNTVPGVGIRVPTDGIRIKYTKNFRHFFLPAASTSEIVGKFDRAIKSKLFIGQSIISISLALAIDHARNIELRRQFEERLRHRGKRVAIGCDQADQVRCVRLGQRNSH